MFKDSKSSLSVSGPAPRVTRLNKKVILAIAAILGCVFLLIIVHAYSVAQEENSPSGSKPAPFRVEKTVAKADIQGIKALPRGYGDTKLINDLLSRGKSNTAQDIPRRVKKELNRLREQQRQLLMELQAMKSAKQTETHSMVSSLDKEAASSAIFFAGGAPLPHAKFQARPKKTSTHKATSSHPGPSAFSQYGTQNMQNQKLGFLKSRVSRSIYNKNTVQYPVSRFIVQAGTIIPAILQSKIVSSLPGMITAIVSENVYDSISGQYLIIPKGSKLIGEYNAKISYGQNELQAKFIRLIRPDGTSIVLPNGTPGVDATGVSGFADTVDNHWGKILGSAALMTLFNIPSIVATNQMNNRFVTSTAGGTTVAYPSLGATTKASVLQSAGQAVSQLGESLANKSLNIQPTIIIHPGYQFAVMVTKDTVLPPYHSVFQRVYGEQE